MEHKFEPHIDASIAHRLPVDRRINLSVKAARTTAVMKDLADKFDKHQLIESKPGALRKFLKRLSATEATESLMVSIEAKNKLEAELIQISIQTYLELNVHIRLVTEGFFFQPKTNPPLPSTSVSVIALELPVLDTEDGDYHPIVSGLHGLFRQHNAVIRSRK